jgi:hypothetical protein
LHAKLQWFNALTCVQPDQNRVNSHFLRLPGEIRNQIYDQILFPRTKVIPISHGRKAHHFGKTVLNHGIFRTSHQIRSEALSFLCATKQLQFCGSDCAIAFLDCIGNAIGDVKHITIAQPVSQNLPMPAEQIDMLFYFFDRATSLQYLKLEVGKLEHPFTWEKELIGDDWLFLEKMLDFVKGRDDLKFRWTAGSYDPTAQAHGSIAWRSGGIRELLGEDTEEWVHYGVINLW